MNKSSRAPHWSDFDKWKHQVNQAVHSSCGLECDDLPDYAYRQAFDDKVPVSVVARRVIARAKGG